VVDSSYEEVMNDSLFILRWRILEQRFVGQGEPLDLFSKIAKNNSF
jgi:hypothetical protein